MKKSRQLLLAHKFTSLLLLVVIILSIGALFYHKIEHLRLLDALYFSTITLTTVGYGDFSPHTDAGKLFTMVYLLVGIGVLLALISIIADQAINNYRRLTEQHLLRAERRAEDMPKEALHKKPGRIS